MSSQVSPTIPAMHSLPDQPRVPDALIRRLRDDYNGDADPAGRGDWEDFVLDRYAFDLRSTYAGIPIRNPFGKASGQLSMTLGQVREDIAAGLGFVVLKTVIAEDGTGQRSMGDWAVPEARMLVERIVSRSGETGWTVTWKGRGWPGALEGYLDLIAAARALPGRTLIVPSCKYHLPGPGENTWNVAEYDHTTQAIGRAWHSGTAPAVMPIEKDFSPTLAGSNRADGEARIQHWLDRVAQLIRSGAGVLPVRIGLKLFNTLYDDDFQVRMLEQIHDAAEPPDYFIYGNRLFDPHREFEGQRGVAYGGPDLSGRNLHVLSVFRKQRHILPAQTPRRLEWSATGNITSGRLAWEYARLGATSFQMHTMFQLPQTEYRLKQGSRSKKVLHEVLFHPEHGFLVWGLHLAACLGLDSRPVAFLEVVRRLQDHCD